MKKFFLAFFLLSTLFCSGVSYASDKSFHKSDKTQISESSSSTEATKQKDRVKKIEEKRVELESTEWQVSLVSKDLKSKPENDTFVFQNGQFKSENRAKKGFNPTNYTVTIPDVDDASATFETMQSGKEGHIFIKGVWTKDSMEGQIIEQSEDNKSSKEYYFSKAKMTKIAPEETKTGEAEVGAASTETDTKNTLVSKEDASPSSSAKK